MGGGKSKSSSSNSNTTTQIDKRIGATDSATVITAEGSSTINLTDGGIIDAASKMLADSLGYDTKVLEQSLASISGFGASSLGAVNKANEQAFSFGASSLGAVNKANEQAFSFANEVRQQADEQNYRRTVQWLAIVAIVAFAAWGYRRGR
jgi:hypothetical protein